MDVVIPADWRYPDNNVSTGVYYVYMQIHESLQLRRR